MSNDSNDYYIMDGRARFDTDRAIVIEVCETLAEAKRAMHKEYKGYDYVVVDPHNNDEIVYDPMIQKKDGSFK